MAELVDALVSNTNAARRAGSIPALGTERKHRNCDAFLFCAFSEWSANGYFGKQIVASIEAH